MPSDSLKVKLHMKYKQIKLKLAAAAWALNQMESDAAWCILLYAHLMKWEDDTHSLE